MGGQGRLKFGKMTGNMTDALNSDNSVRVVTLPDDVAPVVLFGSRDEVLRAMERGMHEYPSICAAMR